MSTWTVYNAAGGIIEQGSNAAANAHDGNTSTYYTLYPPSVPQQSYIIEEDFGQTLTITQFKVYGTYIDNYNQIKVEYWTGSAWSLVGYVTTGNTWTTFSGSWTTSKWRVSWYGDIEVGSAVRVNEMQAVSQTTILNVSDSGTGTETTLTVVIASDTGTSTDQITNRALLGLTDVGSGTETATPPSNLITITESGSGAETADAIPHLFVVDSGWGNEAPTPIVIFYLTDTGGGVEGLLMNLEVYDASSLSGEEIALVFGQIDGGLGTESLPLRLVGVLDDSTGQETSTLIVIAKDNGIGGELAIVTNLLSASDSGVGLEKPLRVIHVGAFVFLRPD
jgi:hypothetical protein